MTDPGTRRSWWKEAVVYQIYPRSFNDSDGDGVGDIPGIIEKLDYLADLGVDVVWLTPVYESPDNDNGYDIADYRSIDERYGTMADWEELLAGLHERDIRLVMDLVVNHTSSEHEWFRRSRESKDSEYRDFYIWREGRRVDGEGGPRGPEGEAPPNDWESFFGGPAWSYDERTGEWYLHLFDVKQPDLNWENPAVREEIFEMMEWWLAKGIDGFRMDVINIISKPEGLPDGEDPNAVVHGADQYVNGPRVHEFLGEMYDRVFAGRDAMTVGEMVDLSVEEAPDYVGEDGDGMSMAFSFDHLRLDFGGNGRWSRGEWSLVELREVLSDWQDGLADDGWNSLHLNNHDQPRAVSRFGDDGEYRRESAKLLGTLTHTLRGTPYVYQGEELGMTNYPFESLDEVRDVDTLQNVATAKLDGRIETEEEALDLVRYRSRDNARTPMQWSAAENAGFTAGEPWIGVNPNYPRINAERARVDGDSVWHYYCDLIDLRSEHDVLVYGAYDLVLADHEEVWAYTRTLGDERALVVLNFADGRSRFEPPSSLDGAPSKLLLCNYEATASAVEPVELRPYEARVYRLTA
ncbi:glycoside hydrolase family 13 protein [Halegenticoccus tardaugens]|uniref:glycoside hydrolase family 13 protein n=1 Tax=Halegenticoccus tardaugens TaxID=2071624 RepID=UPI00100BC03D|nr:alpha-glucosidase [Halegenticoccus tardaugens]